jgi:hypothetical protein
LLDGRPRPQGAAIALGLDRPELLIDLPTVRVLAGADWLS